MELLRTLLVEAGSQKSKKYKYFRFGSRHLEFQASRYIRQYSQQLRLKAGPRKCGVSRWIFDPKCHTSEDTTVMLLCSIYENISVSGFAAAILDSWIGLSFIELHSFVAQSFPDKVLEAFRLTPSVSISYDLLG